MNEQGELEARVAFKINTVKATAFDLLDESAKAKKQYEVIVFQQKTLLETVCNKLECKPDGLLQKIERLLEPLPDTKTNEEPA